MSRRCFLISFLTLNAALMTSHAAWSASQAPALEEVTVVGHRTLPLQAHAAVGKLDVSVSDTPRSIQVVSRDLFDDQGAVRLTDVLNNVSGAAQGGQFAFGFYDRAVLRGLNVSYLTDGLPDGPSELGGIPRSLLGVERVEVIKGPGSALYGASQQGGTVNLVHYRPSHLFDFNVSEQLGSFGAATTAIGVTGPTGLSDLDFRIDAGYDRTAGLRGRKQEFVEVLPALRWQPDGHDVDLRLEYRSIQVRPDASGIPFAPPSGVGLPADVDIDNRYYSPFAQGDQDIVRVLASDAWTLRDRVTLSNRVSFTHRTVDILRNAGGSVATTAGVSRLQNRQIRAQHDDVDDLLYQLELNAGVTTGPLQHHLLAGAQADKIDGHTRRSTADLPGIADLFHPVLLDDRAALDFQCNAAHSCNDAEIDGRFYSVYGVDQVDVTDWLKLRGSLRGDRFDTQGVATSVIPVNPGMQRPCRAGETPAAGLRDCAWLLGVTVERTDDVFSWDAGAVVHATPELSAFVGVANSALPVFNTEEPQTIGGGPEQGKQYEGGLRYAFADRFAVSTAVYEVRRDAVFTVILDPVTNSDVPATFSYRTRGWEVDLNAEPVKGWSIIGNFAHQTPQITNFPATPANVGHVVPSVAPNLANVWTSYDVVMGGGLGSLRLKAGARYRERAYADAGNTRALPGSTLVDTGISWMLERYEISFGVNNVADKVNWQYGAGAGGGAVPGPRRTVFGRISAKL